MSGNVRRGFGILASVAEPAVDYFGSKNTFYFSQNSHRVVKGVSHLLWTLLNLKIVSYFTGLRQQWRELQVARYCTVIHSSGQFESWGQRISEVAWFLLRPRCQFSTSWFHSESILTKLLKDLTHSPRYSSHTHSFLPLRPILSPTYSSYIFLFWPFLNWHGPLHGLLDCSSRSSSRYS